ncbi:MAG TPA: carbon-nitrogen hydrolase family protein [Steroidobacteraceae bacterium]|nr:carbon-nitrogen hydrolase family protein [Steroidobacteraceae bacterium]
MSQPIVAAVQMTSAANIESNLETARRLLHLARAGGACLAVLPENFSFMGRSEAERRRIVEQDGDGPVQHAVSAAAREIGLWIVAGTQPIAVPGEARPANACIVYDAEGRRVARYDKIHLFDVELPGGRENYRESSNAVAGAKPVTVDTPAGRLGLSVCYDLRFPELFRRLVADGAEILSMPSAFTLATGQAHWEILLRARAIENLSFVIAAAQTGIHDSGRETYGDSLIADHWGRVLRRLPRGSGVVLAPLDREAQAAARRSFPALSHRVIG